MNEERELEPIKQLLTEIAEMCDHASLTGSLAGGERRTAARYNSILEQLLDSGTIPESLFTKIPEGSGFSEVGVEARMLASYLAKGKNKGKSRGEDSTDRNVLVRLAPFVDKEELGLLIREHARQGGELDMNTVSVLAPFLGSDILGSLLREHLSRTAQESPAAPKESEAPAPHSQSTVPSAQVYELAVASSGIHPTTGKAESIEDLLDLLKSPYLSEEDRSAAVERLRAATGRG